MYAWEPYVLLAMSLTVEIGYLVAN